MSPPLAASWGKPSTWGVVLGALAIRALTETSARHGPRERARTGAETPAPERAVRLVREWRLDRALARAVEWSGSDAAEAWHAAEAMTALAAHAPEFEQAARAHAAPRTVFTRWFADDAVRRLAGVNEHQGVQWFRKEPFDEWRSLMVAITGAGAESAAWLTELESAVTESGWRVDRLISGQEPSGASRSGARR